MKRKTTRDILADSFKELAEKKNIDKITIKEITSNCGYSTATFYRQFKDKYDLIAWNYARDIREIMNRVGSDGYTWKKTLIDGARYYGEHKEYLSNLFLHTSGLDSFMYNMTEINFTQLKRYIGKAAGLDCLDNETEIYIRIYCLGTVSLTCEWVLGKFKASPEELAEIFEKSLPEPLHKYLYANETIL